MIERKPFGRTGHSSIRTIFGAAALGNVTQPEADQTLALLPAYGVNHIDVAASYGDAELRLGPWMKQHREDFFLATKTAERSYQGAWNELKQSLERLQVDHVDLWQMHNLVEPDEWETAMESRGALEAFIEAREKGLTRFLGVTGHGKTAAAMHLRSLDRFPFDSVLLPFNSVEMQNPRYAADFQALLARCCEQQVAVQTIKSIARRPWGDRQRTHNTWYDPMVEQADIDRAVHWVLGQPEVFVITAADIELFPRILEAASRFQSRPTEDEMVAMAAANVETIFA